MPCLSLLEGHLGLGSPHRISDTVVGSSKASIRIPTPRWISFGTTAELFTFSTLSVHIWKMDVIVPVDFIFFFFKEKENVFKVLGMFLVNITLKRTFCENPEHPEEL